MFAFSKYEATGNDFLVMDARGTLVPPTPEQVIRACDRHLGIGADGVILLGDPTSSEGDCSFALINADGSGAEMSGNGIRALAAHAVHLGIHRDRGAPTELNVDTIVGVRTLTLDCDPKGRLLAASVTMGAIVIAEEDLAAPEGTGLGSGAVVDVGNPHWVFVLEDPTAVSAFDLAQIGPTLEHDLRFPARTNVELIAVESDRSLRFRVWERGAGETLSCGTGATAAAAVAIRSELVSSPVTVHLPGGDLFVEWSGVAQEVPVLTGPVNHCFDLRWEAP
ncbi:MAG: diaminopimelate epimerase [Acidimicrobiia bacterium]